MQVLGLGEIRSLYLNVVHALARVLQGHDRIASILFLHLARRESDILSHLAGQSRLPHSLSLRRLGAWSSHFDGRPQHGPPIDLSELRLVVSTLWIDVVRLQIVTEDHSARRRLSVLIAVGVEGRSAEVGGDGRVSQPSTR